MKLSKLIFLALPLFTLGSINATNYLKDWDKKRTDQEKKVEDEVKNEQHDTDATAAHEADKVSTHAVTGDTSETHATDLEKTKLGHDLDIPQVPAATRAATDTTASKTPTTTHTAAEKDVK